jgi:hypothetical protein
VVELGDFEKYFGEAKSWAMFSLNYTYEINFQESRQQQTTSSEIPIFKIQTGELKSGFNKIIVPIQKTGTYTFVIRGSEDVWSQKVLGVSEKDNQLSHEQEKMLAEKFAPIIQYHQDEKYSPVSFSYLLNEEDIDSELNKEILGLRGIKGSPSFQFKDIHKILPYYGHSESVLEVNKYKTKLSERYGKNYKTVYASVFDSSKTSAKEIYINYHFFYSFDPKNSQDKEVSRFAHAFDRESITVVLSSETLNPRAVIYGAHLPSQRMVFQDSTGKTIQDWELGRIFVYWKDVLKNGNHPFAAAAKGSHGMYPVGGQYAVKTEERHGDFNLLQEVAGGGGAIYPNGSDLKAEKQTSSTYELRTLDLKHLTSNCMNEENILAYSGSIVDVFGPTNATFPPFTDRELNYFEYGYPGNESFKIPAGSGFSF